MASIAISRGTTLPDSSAKSDFHNLIDTATATISNIDGGDISSIATANKVSGISLFNLSSIPSGASIPNTALRPLVNSSMLSGAALFNLPSTPSSAGFVPYWNIVTSLASGAVPAFDGTKNFYGRTAGGFVNRGDPSAYDLTHASMTLDETWRDFDMSSVVPANATAVLLRVNFVHPTTNKQLSFRRNGNANAYAVVNLYTQTAGNDNGSSFVVPCDSNRIIEYSGMSGFSSIAISIMGWFF